jgi:hypothetical protein
VSGPTFIGDDLDWPAQLLPDGPLLFVTYWFDSREQKIIDGKVLDEDFSVRRWIPAPEVYLDGEPVPASWSGWCYPLPVGPHEIEVRSPHPARLTVTVTSLANVTVIYRAKLRFRSDSPNTPTGTGTLIPGG